MNIRKQLNIQSIATTSGRAFFVLLITLIGLSGCGGGASTESTPVNQSRLTGYTGTVTGELHRGYALEVWPNLVPADRCGSCHITGGPGTGAFVDNNIVTAFQVAVPGLINTSNPAQSLLVTRVAAGHNCWLPSNNDCAAAMTRYIENMIGSTSTAGGGNSITIALPGGVDPEVRPGGSLIYPANATDGSPLSFQETVYQVVRRNDACMNCHRQNSSPQIPQSPFFASDDVNTAYEAAKTKMNLDIPGDSRLVKRLEQGHNCFDDPGTAAVIADCVYSANTMRIAIANFAGNSTIPPLQPVMDAGASFAMKLSDGQPASGGNRVDLYVISKWEFKKGTGNVLADSFGSTNLTLTGNEGADFNWIGGNGIQLINSSAQSAILDENSTLFSDIAGQLGSNEYSIEAWIIPDNVADNNKLIVSYGASRANNNYGLGQSMYNYDFLQADAANGVTEVSTPDADEVVATSLQHVVVTYDSQNGRRIYVNGQLTGAPAGSTGNISGWTAGNLFVLGGGDGTPWKGILRMVAIHKRALQQQQIVQNYEAGVGEKLFVLFNVSDVIGDAGCKVAGAPKCFIYFEVSEFDTYSYLFNKPVFISLNPAYMPANVPLRGMRIGINGQLATTGQAYANLNLNLDATNYTAGIGQVLSIMGTIIPKGKGADQDQFYLSFEDLNGTGTAFIETPPTAPVLKNPAAVTEFGVRMFDEINQSMAQLTGIDPNLPSIGGANGVYTGYRQQLPSTPNAGAFLASHQMGISQMAMTYCDELVKDTTKRSAFFQNFSFSRTAGELSASTISDQIINPLMQKMLNIDLANSTNNLTVQPLEADVRLELTNLVNRMRTSCTNCNTTARTAEIVTATCTAALGSATMLVQ